MHEFILFILIICKTSCQTKFVNYVELSACLSSRKPDNKMHEEIALCCIYKSRAVGQRSMEPEHPCCKEKHIMHLVGSGLR